MSSPDHIRLSQLNGKIQKAIAGAFNAQLFWVVADVTSHSFRPAKNYHYFDLVEKDPRSNDIIARISGSAWGNGSARIANFEKLTGQAFTNNIHVLLKVAITYHPVYGLQVSLQDIDPSFTLGVLEQQKQDTLARLVTENPGFIERSGNEFLTANKQVPLNRVIQHIALITSRNSAGGEDFKHSLLHNADGYTFFVDEYFSGVQGDSQADQLLTQVVAVFTSGKPYDVLVITRGGGAQTDLLLFDNYFVGKAVAKFPIPVITGIGHQRNETIADLMAHTAVKTPTKAAEFIIAHNRSFEQDLLDFEKAIVIRSQQFIAQFKDSLAQVTAAVLTQPRMILQDRQNELNNLVSHYTIYSNNYFNTKKTALAHTQSVISLMSPENILKKGFAIIKQHNKIISDAAAIQTGDDIEILLAGNELRATIKQKTEYDGRDFRL